MLLNCLRSAEINVFATVTKLVNNRFIGRMETGIYMKRIMFVDNDVLALQLMEKASRLLGYQAITSSSARQALVLAEDENPSLVFVDLQMDDMDGWEFIRQMRKSPGIAHLPVLVFSAGTAFSDEKLAREVGANGFLNKPVSLADLSKAVQNFALQGSS